MIPALDIVLPDPEHTERHARRVTAPPDAVWNALASISPSDSLFARTIIGLRKLPVRLAGRDGSAALTGRFVDSPPVPVLVREPGEGFVAAGAGTPWRIFGTGASLRQHLHAAIGVSPTAYRRTFAGAGPTAQGRLVPSG